VVREQDLIEGVIYLPENLFYNTSAPGILLFLNKVKPQDRKNKLFLINASRVVEKGDPKNFIPTAGIERIATAFKAWQEEEKFAKVVTREQLAKEDYTILPSRYIHIAEAEAHRPIAEILEELEGLEVEAAKISAALRSALREIGV
jgi:type I restriction enzyme M protein